MFTVLVTPLFTTHIDRTGLCNFAACMFRFCNAD